MDENFNCQEKLEPLPYITIIIPALNEEQYIVNVLRQLDSQTYPFNLVEVFVIDGGSADGTRDVVAKWAEESRLAVKVLPNVKRISSAARNIGIDIAHGEYILFIDAHVFIPSDELIKNMAVAARKMNAMVLGRAQPLNPPMLNDFQKLVAGVRGSKLGHSTKSYIYSDYDGWVSPISVGVMYHRSVFEKSERFDELFDAAEDVEFNYRLELKGYKAYLNPDFKIYYYPRKSFVGLFKQMFRYGLGRARFTNKHFKGFQRELFVPVFTLILALAISCLAFNGNTQMLFIILAISGYLSLMLLFFHAFSNFKQLLLAPFVLLLIHMGLATGLLVGLVECFLIKTNKHKGVCDGGN